MPLLQEIHTIRTKGFHLRPEWRSLFITDDDLNEFGLLWVQRDRALPAVQLHLRECPEAPITLRPATTDAQVLDDTFVGLYHLPPRPLPPDATILDLGANIGLTALHLASLYPKSRIISVEMDEPNAALARRNLAHLKHRCEVVCAAVWSSDGRIHYAAGGGEEWGFRVSEIDAPSPSSSTASAPTTTKSAPAISIPTLMRLHRIDHWDYVKMDVEGAEAELLAGSPAPPSWLAHVGAIKIEIHPPATRESITTTLRAAGFHTADDTRHPRCVWGVRAV